MARWGYIWLACASLCVALAGLQLAVKGTPPRTMLGQDKDWHVHTWTPGFAARLGLASAPPAGSVLRLPSLRLPSFVRAGGPRS